MPRALGLAVAALLAAAVVPAQQPNVRLGGQLTNLEIPAHTIVAHGPAGSVFLLVHNHDSRVPWCLFHPDFPQGAYRIIDLELIGWAIFDDRACTSGGEVAMQGGGGPEIPTSPITNNLGWWSVLALPTSPFGQHAAIGHTYPSMSLSAQAYWATYAGHYGAPLTACGAAPQWSVIWVRPILR